MFMFKNLSTIASSVRNMFTDNFNRPDSGELGNATDQSKWEALRGVFTIFGNKARTTSAASTYPIASITMPDSPLDQDVVITLKGTTPGTGAALWITDSNNWWAVTTGIQNGENCNCQQCTTCNAGNCTGGNCAANGPCNPGPCNAGQNQNWNTPVQNFVTNTGTTPGNGTGVYNGNCRAWNCPTTGNRFCRAWTASCTQLDEPRCNGGYNSGGNARTWRSSPPRNITGWNTRNCSSFSRPCAAYASRTNAPCTAYNFGNCNSNPCDLWNTNNQNFNNPTPWSATNYQSTTPGSPTGNFNACTGGFCSGTYNCATYTCTTYSCTVYSNFSCNCQTCFPSYIRVIKSVAGTVTELTRWVVSNLGTSIVNSMRITTSGSQITVEPYANVDLTGKIGSDLVYTPTGVTLSSSYGIIVEPSPTSQGFEIDEITIEKI